MKTIGMVGGISPESTALYYRAMNRAANARLGGNHSARIALDSLDYHEFADANARDDEDAVLRLLAASLQRLERAGADLLLLACNTAHRRFEELEAAVSRPLLHVGDAAGPALREGGCKRVALLGTRYTMAGGFVAERLSRHGVETILPSADAQARVHGIILTELCKGTVRPESRALVVELARSLAADGADAMLLACTELCMLFPELDASDGAIEMPGLPLPLYDTALLHARAAVEAALGG
jgi:aspartate racemase